MTSIFVDHGFIIITHTPSVSPCVCIFATTEDLLKIQQHLQTAEFVSAAIEVELVEDYALVVRSNSLQPDSTNSAFNAAFVSTMQVVSSQTVLPE